VEVALFSAGRISYPALTARLRWKERAHLERDAPDMCSLSFSLVPGSIEGLTGERDGVRGQWLMMTLKYSPRCGFVPVELSAIRFEFADAVGVGFGRIAVSEIEAPNMLADLV
jgi:hypothetical protein